LKLLTTRALFLEELLLLRKPRPDCAEVRLGTVKTHGSFPPGHRQDGKACLPFAAGRSLPGKEDLPLHFGPWLRVSAEWSFDERLVVEDPHFGDLPRGARGSFGIK